MKSSLLMDLKMKRGLELQFTLMQSPTVADPNHAIVFSAESNPLLLALEHVSKLQNNNFVISSHSLSTLQALQGCDI